MQQSDLIKQSLIDYSSDPILFCTVNSMLFQRRSRDFVFTWFVTVSSFVCLFCLFVSQPFASFSSFW